VNDHIYSVSEIVEALSQFNGQTVTIRGVLTIRRENHSIADFVPDKREVSLDRRLWVYFHHATLGTREHQLSQFDGAHVIVIGSLDVSRKGHFNFFAGSLTVRSLKPDETQIG
jgi:hypothetical protein